MSKRSHSKRNDDTGDGDRSDFIHVGTEFTQHKRRPLKQQRRDNDTDQAEWKPTISFVSSRSKRAERLKLRPEDFMDAQDMAATSEQIARSSAEDGSTFIGSTVVGTPGSGWHGVGYGVDIGSLASSSTVPSPSSLGTLFKRKTKKPMKKPSRGKLLLSFGSAFDDDDESFSYGGKGGFPSNSNDSHAPSALERLASEKQHGPEPNALGFVFVHLLETEQHSVYEGPKVPPTFTGSHKPPSSRWDSVPATGSQSVCGHGRASRTLVTAVDRAKLRIVDDNTTIVSKQEAFLLDAAVARAALERGFMPFVDDMRKQQRYKEFLQSAADGDIVATGSRNQNESTRETKEFARMAHAFQPNTAMLSRFTRSTQQTDAGSPGSTKASATQAAPDTRSSARKHATRTVLAWAPSQLLCKRMGVPPPPTAIPHLPKHPSNTLSNQKGPGRKRAADFIDWSGNSSTVTAPMVVASEQSVVAPTNRPDMSLFKAIFGDSS